MMASSESGDIMLNLGCGRQTTPGWVNLDLVSTGSDVKAADLTRGIPLRDASCRCVYMAHFLEHLALADGRRLLRECWRVLRPTGILRVVVPDLEELARDYLAVVDRRRRGERVELEHEWLVLELIDQAARVVPGGEMMEFVRSHGHDPAVVELLRRRIGNEAEAMLAGASRGRGALVRRTLGALRRVGRGGADIVGLVLVHLRGEVHRVMYDEYRLADELRRAGFGDVRRRDADHSGVHDWRQHGLDVGSDGKPRKPGSLYMEAARVSCGAA